MSVSSSGPPRVKAACTKGCTLHKGCCVWNTQRQALHHQAVHDLVRALSWQETAAVSVKAPNVRLACNDAQEGSLKSRQDHLKTRSRAVCRPDMALSDSSCTVCRPDMVLSVKSCSFLQLSSRPF